MNIVLIGAPLSGKGTQAQLLCEKLGFYHISTGDLFREIMQTESDLKNEIKPYMDKHILVPDELTIKVFKEKLSSLSNKDILLDGFPRTLNQAVKLNDILKVDKVIYLKTELENLLNRVKYRYVCEKCKKINTVHENESLVCSCGGNLIKRQDDEPEIVISRYNEFLELTMPVVNYYLENNCLEEIDANLSQSQVFENILEGLKE